MKNINIIHSILLILSFSMVSDFVLGQNVDRTHIDFLPKYLKKNPDVLITRIEYFSAKMIIHFRYIAEQRDTVKFYGKLHPKAWILQSGSTAAKAGSNILQKTADVCNIRINDQLKASWLPANQEVGYLPERGDIVSCEIHIEKMPHFIKVVSMSGGDIKMSKDPVFLFTDLMLKTPDNTALGTIAQMETIVENYYKDYTYIRYPNLKYLSSIENEKLDEEDLTTYNTPIKESMEPVTYMPKYLNRIEDLKCKERIIMRNVYFADNSSDFSKRTLALKTIGIVYDYLIYYPDAKIVLHGHTDVYGNPYENIVLSKERVLAVKRVLMQRGIDKHRIITLYHGGEQPLPNCEQGHELNRRVEVEIVCDDTAISSTKN